MARPFDNWGIGGIFASIAVVVFIASPRGSLWHGPSSQPELITVEGTDAEMNAAMDEARQSVDIFLQALHSPPSAPAHLSVKVGFRDERGVEFMWLHDVTYRDGTFHGTVGNSPQTVRSVRFGAPVAVGRDEIADWMFIREGKLVGGYTMRVMRSRLSPGERADFDANTGFTID